MVKRSGPKAWKPTGRVFKNSTRPKYRKRPTTEGMTKRVPGVPKASNVHRFTRSGCAINIVSTLGSAGLLDVMTDVPGPAVPISLTSTTPTPTGVSNSYSFGGSCQWQLNDLVNNTEFSALFDQYTIEQVDVEISNLHNSATATDAAQTMPTIVFVPDFDDAGLPASAQALEEYQRSRQWTFRGDGGPLKFSIKPRMSTVLYQAFTPAYAPGKEGQMLSMTNAGIPHYGFKFWVSDCYMSGGARGETNLRIKMKYHLKFANPK